MKREDERILEYLDETGIATPALISREIFKSISPGHVEERLKMMEYAERVFCGGFESCEMTLTVKIYLNGQLDVSNRPTPTVDRVLR